MAAVRSFHHRPAGGAIVLSTDQSRMTLDCQSCGACCQAAGEVVVRLGVDQVARHLTRSVRNKMGFASWEADDIRIMARNSAEQCVAFRGEIGASCRCAIYAKRPTNCREFVAGSAECHDARERMLLS